MKPRTIGIILIVATTATWGGAWVTARAAAHDAPALWMAVGRFAFAAIVLLPMAALLKRPIRLRHDARTWWHLAGMALTGAIGYNLFFLLGIERAPASDGAVITPGLSGFFGALFVWALDGIKPRKWAIVGGVLALAGAAIIGFAAWQGGGGTERLIGNLLFATASVVWGIYTAIGRRLSGHVQAVEGVFWATALAVLFWAPVAWATSGAPTLHWAEGAYWNMAYLGAIATAVGFVTWYLAVQRLGADRAGPGLGLVPVFGVGLAAIFLGETIQWPQIVGGAVVVLGIALSAFDGTRKVRIRHRFDVGYDVMWARLTDFSALHRYSPDLASSDVVEGPPFGIGTTRRNVLARPRGGLTETIERITHVEDGWFGYDVVGGVGPYHHATGEWRLNADGSGCRIEYEAVLHCGFVGWLAWPLAKRNLRGGLERLMTGLGQ